MFVLFFFCSKHTWCLTAVLYTLVCILKSHISPFMVSIQYLTLQSANNWFRFATLKERHLSRHNLLTTCASLKKYCTLPTWITGIELWSGQNIYKIYRKCRELEIMQTMSKYALTCDNFVHKIHIHIMYNFTDTFTVIVKC